MKISARRAAILAAAVLFAGCNEWGLPGKNRPLADVTNKEWRYPVYEKTGQKPMIVANRPFQSTGLLETMSQSMLTPVATVNGAAVFALKSDAAPFDRLYTASPDGRYNVVMPLQ